MNDGSWSRFGDEALVRDHSSSESPLSLSGQRGRAIVAAPPQSLAFFAASKDRDICARALIAAPHKRDIT